MLRRRGFEKYHLNVAAIFSVVLILIVGLLAIHINPIGSDAVTGFSVQEFDFNAIENISFNLVAMSQALIVLALTFAVFLSYIKSSEQKKKDTAI